jgi:hypothetical protein
LAAALAGALRGDRLVPLFVVDDFDDLDDFAGADFDGDDFDADDDREDFAGALSLLLRLPPPPLADLPSRLVDLLGSSESSSDSAPVSASALAPMRSAARPMRPPAAEPAADFPPCSTCSRSSSNPGLERTNSTPWPNSERGFVNCLPATTPPTVSASLSFLVRPRR